MCYHAYKFAAAYSQKHGLMGLLKCNSRCL